MAAAKTPTTKAEKAATAVYEVTSPLWYDHVRYEIGDAVELTAAQAAPLLDHTVKAIQPSAAR